MRKLSDSKLEIDRLAYFKLISKLSLAELKEEDMPMVQMLTLFQVAYKSLENP